MPSERKFFKMLVTGAMAYYHGPCKDDLEVVTGGNRLEKRYSEFIPLTNP
jgi:hypothetical protein